MFNRYINIGILSITSISSGILVYFFIFNNPSYKYMVIFNEPVNGLYKGSEVWMNGIPVGRVESVALAEDNFTKAKVILKIKETIPKLERVQAEISMKGITGNFVVSLFYTGQEEELQTVDGITQIPVRDSLFYRARLQIESLITPNSFDEFSENTKKTLSLTKETMQELLTSLRKINKMMDDLQPIVGNLKTIFARSHQVFDDLLPIFHKVRSTVESEAFTSLTEFDIKTVSHIIADLRHVSHGAKVAINEFNKGPFNFIMHGKK